MAVPPPPRRIPHDRPAESWDRGYWLNRCQGFEVMAHGLRVGTITEVRYVSRADVPDLIVVRTGRLRPYLHLIPVDQVERIDADSARLELTAGATAIKRHQRSWNSRAPRKRIAPSGA